ncbi:MAG: alpha-hydroxy-acid oxidizing protein [Oscillospiraceae bacterium]|nr:alpha-hydroxy-acid oxidizing protein [Oscillospiraceae bacterium]
MDYKEVCDTARKIFDGHCSVCPVCNGKACGNRVPGPGCKAPGQTAARNYDKWQEILLNMDTICANDTPDTQYDLFGKTFRYPFFAAPIGGLKMHYGGELTDVTYNNLLIPGCYEAGIAAFTGDGVDPEVMINAAKDSQLVDGIGIPTIKPWNIEAVQEKLDILNKTNIFAVAMDIDGAGLPFLKALNPNAGSKPVEELQQIIQYTDKPFILKGIMTVKGAEKAVAAGAKAIVVSNHGGRVLGSCPGTAEVLPEIVDAVGKDVTILVDGGIRSGTDIFRALAVGADAVLIGRPFVPAVYGGGKEGVRLLVEKLAAELKDTMTMCGAHSLEEISRDMIRFAK